MKECLKNKCKNICKICKCKLRELTYPIFKKYPEIEATSTGIDNKLPIEYLPNCEYMLDTVILPLKERFPNLFITSWYRSVEVNKEVGGVANSSHLTAQGIDVSAIPEIPVITLFKWIKRNIKPDYVKMYKTHIHITKRKKVIK